LKWFIFIFVLLSGIAAQTEKGVTINSKEGNEGKRWAICIGVNDYEYDGISKLTKARNDAEALGQALKEYGQFDFVYVMTDKNDHKSPDYPYLRKLQDKLDYLKEFIEPQDLVVFAFSGHGIANDKGESYLVLADTNPNRIFETSLKLKDVTDIFQKTGVKKSLLFVDACREEFQQSKGINARGLKAEKFENSEVAATFYATKDGWYSYEDDKSDYGAFTNYILKGIKGEADNTDCQGNGDGIVTFTELSSFVEVSVTNWALERNKKQKPYTKIYGEKYGDLALSSYKIIEIVGNKNDDLIKKANKQLSKSLIEMIFVEGGSFEMGNKNAGWMDSDEKPVHKVTLDGFYIGKYEVTQKEYRHIMGNNPSKYKDDDRPVEKVSWYDAIEFCNKLSEKEGLQKCYIDIGSKTQCNFKANGYRLPTEAEWEYAARGGSLSEKFEYSGSDIADEVAWFGENSGKETKPVGTKKANELSIYDMSGNVWEWCWDSYEKDYYEKSSVLNPRGPDSGTDIVVRGGDFFMRDKECRVTLRPYPTIKSRPQDKREIFGFRIAKNGL